MKLTKMKKPTNSIICRLLMLIDTISAEKEGLPSVIPDERSWASIETGPEEKANELAFEWGARWCSWERDYSPFGLVIPKGNPGQA